VHLSYYKFELITHLHLPFKNLVYFNREKGIAITFVVEMMWFDLWKTFDWFIERSRASAFLSRRGSQAPPGLCLDELNKTVGTITNKRRDRNKKMIGAARLASQNSCSYLRGVFLAKYLRVHSSRKDGPGMTSHLEQCFSMLAVKQ
jgi:hypothetical protein